MKLLNKFKHSSILIALFTQNVMKGTGKNDGS